MNKERGVNDNAGRYDDILHLPHHTSSRHPRMPMESRAAQFAPFAALEGYEESVQEMASITCAWTGLSPDEQKRLALRLSIALGAKAPVKVTYFIPDYGKTGGRYSSHLGVVSGTDACERLLIFEDNFKISLDSICGIDGNIFDETM